jgi:hypothetical protein
VPKACSTVVSLVFDENELVKLAGGSLDAALARTVFLGRAQTIYVSVPRAFKMLTQLADRTRRWTAAPSATIAAERCSGESWPTNWAMCC